MSAVGERGGRRIQTSITRRERRAIRALQRSAGRSTSTQLAVASTITGTRTRSSACQNVSGISSWTCSA